MGHARIRRASGDSVGHCHHEMSSPRPASAFEDFFDVELPPSRPVSEAYMSGNSTPAGAVGARPPTLTDILLDVASPPWTLSAFMAYLSQNHCMETLEFTLDSQRYTTFYNELILDNSSRSRDSDDRVCSLWEKLMQVYIISCAPREVNLPASVRDHLLSLPCGPTPPHPSQLDEAGRIIYELMNDSLLVPFLQSVSPLHLDHDDHIRSPRFATHSKMMGGPIRSTISMQTLESESLTDDSDCNSPPAMEPMTPPTTPPTSEWSFNNHHHGGFHRAVVAHNKGWKKVGAKLGFKSKTSSRRSTPTSGDVDIDMNDSL